MITCTGMLLLSLCIPVPGMTREVVEHAGWRLGNDQPGSTDSYGSVWMRWNELILLVGVSVDKSKVQSVLITESKNRSAMTVKSWLKANCRARGDNWTCTAGKWHFDAISCAGGWALAPRGNLQGDAGIADLCRESKPLFDSL
jgi:hypothetical protein